MATMSDLPGELVTEILSMVPITSLGAVRSTLKKWNLLSQNRIFGKEETAAARKQFLGFMMKNYKICSLRFDLHGIRNDGDFIDPSIKQIGILNQVEIAQVFHCNGLLLCVIKDRSKLVVWNPYLGQTKWIQPRNNFLKFDRYALGYENSNNRNHKILRIFDQYEKGKHFYGYEVFDLRSSSWSVLDVNPDWDIATYQRGVSLNGSTYFFSRGKGETEDFLLCFDFTTESFGSRLFLPIDSHDEDVVTLSCVRDEKLALLYQQWESCQLMEIWITTKIEHNVLSWSKFLEVDMEPLTGFAFDYFAGSFFIDEEKKVVVVFDLNGSLQTAYIIGEDGYFKSVNLGEEAPDLGEAEKLYNGYARCVPLVSSSFYVPSLVQL